jgi:hypothetical protein
MSELFNRRQNLARHAQTAPKQGRRLMHVDTLRGLLLVLMAINHIPSALHAVTDHPFGYMSAAEGFVFMAGLMAGYVYTRTWKRGDFHSLRTTCLKRAATIYRWHVGVYLTVLAGLLAAAFSFGESPANTPQAVLDHPILSIFSGLLLVQQPTLFDILPLYCVLLVVTPWLLRLCEQGRYAPLMFGSLGLWAATNIFSPQEPFDNGIINTGAFNLAAWQLLYIGGLAFGHRWASRQTATENPSSATSFLLPRPSSVVLAALAVTAAFLFCVRHGFLPSGLSESALAAVTNKNNFAPLRLLNTGLIAYLGYLIVSRCPQAFSWRPFALIGRASLSVFCVHVLAAYMIQASPALFADTASGQWLGTALMLGAITLTALMHGRFSAKKASAASGNQVAAPPLKTRQPRVRRPMVRHEPRSPLATDPLHRRSR